MTLMSNIDRHWRGFPELSRLLNRTAIPGHFYHHGGLRSPYTTEMDDLHDFAAIAAIVGGCQEQVRSASCQRADEDQREYFHRVGQLEMEVEKLERRLRHFMDGFLRVRVGELQKLRSEVRQTWHQTMEGIRRRDGELPRKSES